MKYNAQQYFAAATERMNQSRILYNRGDSYALAMYVAGVAVECMFRAFKMLRTNEFDERHDMLLMFAHSHMLEYNECLRTGQRDTGRVSANKISAWVSEIHIRWANDYRYASEDRLKSEMTSKKRYHKIKGDVLKANACLLLNAADKLIERGARIWKELSKKSNKC